LNTCVGSDYVVFIDTLISE